MFIPTDEYIKIQSVLPILCVDCLIVHEQKCLLLKRTSEPAKGQYWFPGGRIYKGESIKEAALRKARDEVNLNCNYERIISVEETIFAQQGNMLSDIHTVNICCQLTANNIDNIKIDEAHSGYMLVNLDQAQKLNLHDAVFLPILKCFEQFK